jgi:hypothetical protein
MKFRRRQDRVASIESLLKFAVLYFRLRAYLKALQSQMSRDEITSPMTGAHRISSCRRRGACMGFCVGLHCTVSRIPGCVLIGKRRSRGLFVIPGLARNLLISQATTVLDSESHPARQQNFSLYFCYVTACFAIMMALGHSCTGLSTHCRHGLCLRSEIVFGQM